MEAQKFDKLFTAWEQTVDTNMRLLACQGKVTEYAKCRVAMTMWQDFDLTEEQKNRIINRFYQEKVSFKEKMIHKIEQIKESVFSFIEQLNVFKMR